MPTVTENVRSFLGILQMGGRVFVFVVSTKGIMYDHSSRGSSTALK